MQIERKRGDTLPIRAEVTSAKTRKPVNITGCSFKLTADSRMAPPDESTQIFQIVGTVEDAEGGVVNFAPTEEQVDRVGFFYYDIQMIDSYGKIITLDSDSFVLKQDITK